MRVVLDTNVIVSRHMSRRGAPARNYEFWQQRRFDVLVTHDILNEYADVFSRPAIQRRTGISVEDVSSMISEIVAFAVIVTPEHLITGVSSDPDGDVFLECALAGSADYIVTGDRHLLDLGTFRGIPIVPPAIFAAILDQESESS